MGAFIKGADQPQPLRWFEFNQNNSGGSFDIDDSVGIGPTVWIEARSTEDARSRALNIGIYFDGVADGRDCECCGDRWNAPWRDGLPGLPKPKINPKYDFNWHDKVFLHHADGRVQVLKKGEEFTP